MILFLEQNIISSFTHTLLTLNFAGVEKSVIQQVSNFSVVCEIGSKPQTPRKINNFPFIKYFGFLEMFFFVFQYFLGPFISKLKCSNLTKGRYDQFLKRNYRPIEGAGNFKSWQIIKSIVFFIASVHQFHCLSFSLLF